MKTIRLQNRTSVLLRLSIEPFPDQYDVAPGDLVNLLGFDPLMDVLEVSVHQDADGTSVTVESTTDIVVTKDNVRLDPM